MTEPLGDHLQKRAILDQTAEAAISKVLLDHPDLRRADVPAPLKWAGVIIGSLFTVGTAGLFMWLVSSVASMQVLLARMDERSENQTRMLDGRMAEFERRIGNLERFHQGGGK